MLIKVWDLGYWNLRKRYIGPKWTPWPGELNLTKTYIWENDLFQWKKIWMVLALGGENWHWTILTIITPNLWFAILPNRMNCSSQPSMVNGLSSPIFPFVCSLSRYGDIRPNLTSRCPTPPKPYIFWKLMIIAIQKWIKNTNTKTKTNTKTMTKTKTPRE